MVVPKAPNELHHPAARGFNELCDLGHLNEPVLALGHVTVPPLGVPKSNRTGTASAFDLNRTRRLAIASRAPDLLIIALDASGQGGMNHSPDIGLINAHSKSDGGDHHL